MTKKQALPEYLRRLRKFYRYTQNDIALQLKITRQTYSHYETGRITPSVNVLYRLAKFYGISVDEILEQTAVGEQDLPENDTLIQNTNQVGAGLFQKDFLSCFRSLNEKDREEILSIMWEIMQVKKKMESNDMR